jgi:hypothetical protein
VDPIDIVMLSHNRLEFLEATVDALYERTPEPFRLTIVDNASGSDVRTWLAANRARFERVIPLARNEHVAAFQHGIDATTSDPFIVTDPDLIVPALEPSWLARLRDLLDRHPDVGLLGASFDHHVPPGGDRDVDIVDANVGTWFQLIRRDALREPYVKDSSVCNAVRGAGYRAGWTPRLVVEHLGAHDAAHYPAHIAVKNEVVAQRVEREELSPYPFYYAQLEVIPRAPTLSELARAAPALAEVRAAAIPPASVLELAWPPPAVGAVYDETVSLHEPPGGRLPLGDGSAGAVVVLEPPGGAVGEVLAEAFRVAAKLVVLQCELETVGGRMAHELAAEGWDGSERPALGPIVAELARRGDEVPALASEERFTTLQDRDAWLSFFEAGAFGSGSARVFVFRRTDPLPVPERVQHDDELPRWHPEPRPPASARASLPRRAMRRAKRLRDRLRSRL